MNRCEFTKVFTNKDIRRIFFANTPIKRHTRLSYDTIIN